MPSSDDSPIQLTLPEQLMPYLAEALVRFQYLNPDATVDVDGPTIRIRGKDGSPDLKRDLLFCVYRQKIYAESLPMRKALIEGVTGA